MPAQKPIRLAFIGAGIFARDGHLPAIQSLAPAYQIVAVYSQSQATASAFASLLPGTVDTYTDLSALLARPDIEAVDILLPIDVMPAVVQQALRAGKHVVSEKPVAPDVATGRALLGVKAAKQVWMVAENYRYESAFIQAGEIVKRGELGRLLLCHWAAHVGMTPGNKYYPSLWRRSNRFPVGYLLDGGVHYVAALRLVLGEIDRVTAMTAQMRDDLPPADTLSATLHFDGGLIGTLGVTHAGTAPWPPALRIVGERGAISVYREELEVTCGGETRRQSFARGGIQGELAAFAAAIREGAPHRNTPEEALQDVSVVEAILQAADSGRAVSPERIVR